MVDFLPAHMVQSHCADKYPNGCYVVHYRGGGLCVCIPPTEVELLAKVIRACANDYTQFWNDVTGRDLTAPKVLREYHDRKPKSTPKMKHAVAQLTLEDIGL